jgi:hypothetical protein
MLIIATVVGLLQYTLLKNSFIRFPLKFYAGLEKVLFCCFFWSDKLVKVGKVKKDLAGLCCCGDSKSIGEEEHESQNEGEKIDQFYDMELRNENQEIDNKEEKKV